MGLEKRKETRCHTATLSLVHSPLETLPGAGSPKHGQKLGEGFKKLPEMYQITKRFLLMGYAPGLVLAIGDTKIMVTSLTASSCLDHPWAQIFLRPREAFSSGPDSSTAPEGTHGWGQLEKMTVGISPADFNRNFK